MTLRLRPLCLAFLAAAAIYARESDALAISKNIQALHLPYGTVLDPVFVRGNSRQVLTYTRCGDSAIWTGHYLAAEAFRWAATRPHSEEALENAKRAVAGLKSLVDVTGTDLLARCRLPADSPYARFIQREEARHGLYTGAVDGVANFWIGNTSRDQYSGAVFGLAVAYDFIDDAGLRASIRELTTRMLNFLHRQDWVITMPDGGFSTMYLGRKDQELSLLAVGRHMNPDRFEGIYRSRAYLSALETIAPIAVEVLDAHGSYFKFNLDYINLFNLIRLENDWLLKPLYSKTYSILRNTTDDHGNAFFNMIDRALRGANGQRDASTRAMLQAWLKRPRRDIWRDLRGDYAACEREDRACEPIPVERRVTTDFLWQRSPFLLYGGGAGRVEGAGIDYILPYWMARYYGVVAE